MLCVYLSISVCAAHVDDFRALARVVCSVDVVQRARVLAYRVLNEDVVDRMCTVRSCRYNAIANSIANIINQQKVGPTSGAAARKMNGNRERQGRAAE